MTKLVKLNILFHGNIIVLTGNIVERQEALGSLKDDVEESSSKLKDSNGAKDFFLNHIRQEGSNDFVVGLVPFAEQVLAEGKGLLREHDKEQREFESVELLFSFDKVMAGLFDHFLEVILHLLVSDKL